MTRGPLLDFVERHRRLFVLTGAGCSTASGIPDYRDANGDWKRAQPVMLHRFLADDLTRKRYWARSLVGWRRMSSASPNDAHRALAALEHAGRVEQLVTQNVDGLHQAAGSRDVIDLHGRIDVVRCLSCDERASRADVQAELVRRNPVFASRDARTAPDGDADLESVDFATFDVPACSGCGGVLKPVGSSLMVYSGYRLVQAMAQAGKPIAAINLGRTRADDLLSLKVTEDCGAALSCVQRFA